MSKTIRVLVNGAKGRMGVEAVKAVQSADDMTLVASLDKGDDLSAALANDDIDAVVDFTVPKVAYINADTILHSRAAGVIGTTGFTIEQIHDLRMRAESKNPGMIVAPNFAIGAILMMHCAHIIAHHMPHVEIVEMHHEAKQDAPSGTARKTAELISHAVDQNNVPKHYRDNEAHGYVHCNVPIHSVRLPGFMAHQEVIFGEDGQVLRLRHDTFNRSCYMPGVLLAIRESIKRSGLTYGLENILFNK